MNTNRKCHQHQRAGRLARRAARDFGRNAAALRVLKAAKGVKRAWRAAPAWQRRKVWEARRFLVRWIVSGELTARKGATSTGQGSKTNDKMVEPIWF